MSTLQTSHNSSFSASGDGHFISAIEHIPNDEQHLLTSDRSDLTRMGAVEQMRRAIDSYKEYKSESNFSLNSSRCYDKTETPASVVD